MKTCINIEDCYNLKRGLVFTAIKENNPFVDFCKLTNTIVEIDNIDYLVIKVENSSYKILPDENTESFALTVKPVNK